MYFGNTLREIFSDNRNESPTNTGRQRVVPRSSLPSHALEKATSMESVAGIASVNDSATSKVALVTNLVSKLRDAGVFAM